MSQQGPPSRTFFAPVGGYVSPGARKEKLRERVFSKASTSARYAELHVASAFSFLRGSSLPEDLVARAAELGLPAVALSDVNGVYGAPRFFKAARQAGIRALVGSEVILDEPVTPAPDGAGSPEDGSGLAQRARHAGPRGIVPLLPAASEPSRLTLLCESRAGYRNLCRLLTLGAAGKAKGEARVTWRQVAEHAGGLHALTGGEEGPASRALEAEGMDGGRHVLERLAALFPGRLHVELQRHGRRAQEHRNRALFDLAAALRLPLVATNGVRHARRDGKDQLDILTCIRLHTNVDAAGRRLEENRERHLKSAAEMAELFADAPEALANAADLADRLDFTLSDLGYRFPDFPLPPGETTPSYLRKVTWEAARTRFRPLTTRAQAQIQKELALIEKLGLAGYFLIVWDIVRFCQREGILVQGRGSAANSAVCYALSITAVDPVRMDLLFERFLSEERGEWPDIDLDLPSGERRERVIQHVYQTYGPHGAAMTANVITYRDRSAARETAKALGFSPAQVDTIAKRLGSFHFGEYRDKVPGDAVAAILEELGKAGFDVTDVRMRHLARLFLSTQNLPRHLGQHSGGMVIAQGRLDEVVPLEPASMPGRVVVQWDKDDCADLGIIKIDLLGLGMLGAIQETIPMIRDNEKVEVDLAQLPHDDPAVYRMLNEADTVGCFQVESRAQMASLPRHAPRVFYDVVVQVAIIRPGPIQGGMVHPFFDRRQGKIPVDYLHPSLEPILKRTLGVPIFQEQILRMAMVAAGFTGGEAEELRRAMGFKRSAERMEAIVERLHRGMEERGIDAPAREQIVKSITSFALYGFPESHAASFALIAYASCWLRAHHPAAFLACLLNAWPMGFYHPATLVKDAQRHGVTVLPADVDRSGWLCRWEAGGVRLGLRFVKGLRQAAGLSVEAARAERPFESTADLARRAHLHQDELTALAHAGALGSLDLSRRAALWQVAQVARPLGPLFEGLPPDAGSPLPEMSPFEETVADYVSTEMTAGPHLVAHLRPKLEALGVVPAGQLTAHRDGDTVRTGGVVVVRQRPGTAKGFVFLSLEDETGIVQAIVRPDLFRENRPLIVGASGLVVEGRLQRRDGTLSIRAARFLPLPGFEGELPSHDFR